MSTSQKTIRLLFSHAWRYKWRLILLLSWMPILIILNQVIPPIIVANILDSLSTGKYISGDVWSSFGPQLVIYGILTFFTNTLGWRLVIYLVWTLEMKVTKDILHRIYLHLMVLDMDFHNNSFGGSLVSKSNKLVGAYMRLADTFVFEFVGLIVMSIATGVVLWSRAPQFVIAFYILLIAYILVAVKITKKIRTLSSIEASRQNKVTGYLADMVTNVLAVKSFAGESYESKRFSKATADVVDAQKTLMRAQLKRENIFASFTGSLTVVALVMAVVSVVDYGSDIGTVFLVLNFTVNMTVRLWDFAQRTLRNINKSLGDAEEATIMLYREPEIIDPINPKKFQTNSGKISFENMSFSHDHIPLFSDFNLTINDGEKIGLVGRSGSGKTTLTKLILRFKDVNEGSIIISGVDIRTVSQIDLRTIISYVPQEPLLFHRTLRENISYGKPDASIDDVIKAAKNAHAHEFIEKLELGYDTLVGERGVKLSGGQKQRIAIARAMLKNAPILLLDEATSALDSESEGLIQDSLWKLMEGKTAIVIAHRLSTIQKMDKIIVLEDGKIVEQGKHSVLSKKKNGHYARLWKHQSGGFLQD